MESLLIILVCVLILISSVILYFQLKTKPKQEENPTEKIQEEINSLRNSLNESFGSMSKDMAKDFTASFGSMTKDIAKDMTGALTKVDEKVAAFNTQVENLNKSQEGITKVLAGVKKYGTLAEFSLDALIKDLLPASQYMTNVKMKEDTGENVEFAIKLQDGVLVPVDKAKSVNDKYIVPPKSTDFAIVYAPTESLFSELTSYQDPTTKELLTQEIMKKYKVVILGPNTLSAYLQSLHMGFQTLKVQKHATEIYDHLKTISTRFSKHFDGIINLRKKLEEAMSVVDKFGTDARSITRTLENIKDPGQIEIAAENENVEKFEDHSKQLKN